jgi:hypothetical protein
MVRAATARVLDTGPVPSAFGLCDRCLHQRLIGNTRGSTFSLCGRSKADPRFPRYPRMPVAACPGFEPRPPGRDPERGPGSSSAGAGAGR